MKSLEFETKIKSLTEEPGVYQMKDASGEILYVGKAKNLKKRVLSYFQHLFAQDQVSASRHSPRIELMVQKVADVEVIITDNEVEALILEFNLIKKNKPRFNVMLKDDKSFPYVRLDLEHPYPKLEYVRRVQKGSRNVRYFGPYVSAFEIKDVLRWAHKTFRLRDCSDNEFRNRSRACILYQMGQCSGPCVGKISEKEYGENIDRVLKILDGKTKDVVSDLKTQMNEASEKEEFEKAAEIRDRIQNIENINSEQKMIDPESSKDMDLVHLARLDSMAVIVVMSNRDGRTVGVQQFPFTDIDTGASDAEFLFMFLTQYYLKRHEQAPQILPSEIGLPLFMEEISEQLKTLESALGKRHHFHVIKKGNSNDLLLMLKKTADFHLTELTSKTTNKTLDLLDVQKKLHLRNFPHRMECFDISHFQGEGTVASRVVFIDGAPEKSFYRHYHVQTVGDIDDFKSMREIIERRFQSTDLSQGLPDLVLIDGGKGQLAQAEAVFKELGIIGVELASIAKARTERDFESQEIKMSSERIFKPNQKNYILLKPGTGAFRQLTSLRDEAHRFAIEFHRKIRDKRVLGK